MARDKKPNGYWLIEENVRAEASKYKSKTEFKLGKRAAYTSMCNMGISDELFPNGKKSNGYWTIDRCIEAAKRYSSISEFSTSKDAKAYQYLSKAGIIREHTKHMVHQKFEAGHWTLESCTSEALKYKTMKEFQLGAPGAYDKCHKNGWLDLAGAHMVCGFRNHDCVYIWKVVGKNNIYKFGVSRESIVTDRIGKSSKSNDVDYEIVIISKCENPLNLERKLLSIGSKYKGFNGDGYTEFRSLNKEELNEALATIKENKL